MFRIYRKIFELKNVFCSNLRVWHLTFKYPSLKITGKSYIGKNCHIVCVDGGNMILNNAHINNGSFLHCANGASLIIESSFVGMNSVIVALSSIDIKANCEIAEMVVIRDQDHQHDLSSTPIKHQGFNSKPIIINENVWVGAKATILKGVEIGKNSIVGAHSLVNNSFPENSKLIGIPAKKQTK